MGSVPDVQKRPSPFKKRTPPPAEEKQQGEESTALTAAGKPRKKRPDGSYYSSDPAIRIRQLQEDKKVGPEYGKLGGRPRKPRVGEQMKKLAEEKMEEIRSAFDAALDPDLSTVKQRVDAAKALVKTAQTEEAREDKEERDSKKGDREAMMERMLDLMLGDTPAAEQFRERLAAQREEPIDAEVVEADELPSA